MDRKSLAALFLLGIAVLFGIVTDLLLTDVSWGLNVSLWSAFVLVVVHFCLKARDKRGLASHWPLACLILHFAGLFAWRDSTTLKTLDGIVLFSLIAFLAARIRYEWSPWQPFGEYAARVSRVLLSGFTGAASVVQKDVDWKQLSEGEYAGAAKAVGRGFLFALPLVLLFTFLLASADVRFERLLTNSIQLDAASLITHFVVIVASAWLAAGYLRDISQKDSASVTTWRYPLALGIVEIAIILGLLDLLFAVFVTLQIPYLFGGAGHVIGRAGVTYAEYARRGFFELVWVSALVLPLLLHAHAMLRAAGRGGEKLFRLLAGIMIALLFVIMASAMQRMSVYQGEYGLTELRFYTSAFMGWLTLVFVWFVPTVLGGLRDRFTFGAIAVGLGIIFALHVANPDAHIVRVNLTRTVEGKPFDPRYSASLSLDSIPELVTALPKLSPSDRRVVMDGIFKKHQAVSLDWRGWNWSSSRALDLMSGLTFPQDAPHTVQPPVLAPVPLPDIHEFNNPFSPVIPIPFTPDDREKVQFKPLARSSEPSATKSASTARPSLPAKEGIE